MSKELKIIRTMNIKTSNISYAVVDESFKELARFIDKKSAERFIERMP